MLLRWVRFNQYPQKTLNPNSLGSSLWDWFHLICTFFESHTDWTPLRLVGSPHSKKPRKLLYLRFGALAAFDRIISQFPRDSICNERSLVLSIEAPFEYGSVFDAAHPKWPFFALDINPENT